MLLNNLNGSINDKCVDMENVQVFVYESSHSSWTEPFSNLTFYKNTNVEEIQSLSNITQKLILEHSEEILIMNTIDSASAWWLRSVLSHDQVIQWTGKLRVYSDSLLCLGKMNDRKDAITRWEGQVEEFKNVSFLQGIAGNRWITNWIRVEYYRRILVIADSSENPGWFARAAHQTWRIYRLDHLHVNVQRHRLDKKRKRWNLYFEFRNAKEYAKRCSQGHWTFLGPGDEKKWSLHTWRKMWFCSHSNGGTIQRFWWSSTQEY